MDHRSGNQRSKKKQGQLASILRKRFSTRPTIDPRPTSEAVPLSVPQERFWLLNELDPGNPVYNRPLALRLSGRLDSVTLSRALDEILKRHEILRCTVQTIRAMPRQTIFSTLHLDLVILDLQSTPPSDREKLAKKLAVEDINKPFDLAAGPLIRALLLRLHTLEHLLVVTMSHMLCDAWSARIFVKELATFYDAISCRQQPALPELHVQYADFSWWQRKQIESGSWVKDVKYWEEVLSGAPSSLHLPMARARPPKRSYHGHAETIAMPASIVKPLVDLAAAESATLFMILFSAFNILLYRYTAQTDLVVGVPVSGRHHPEVEDLMGFFSNTLALRSDLSGSPTFQQLLQRMKKSVLEAHKHQELPFDTLLGELQLKRESSLSPLFQVLFNFENFSDKIVNKSMPRIEEIKIDSGTVPYDLSFELIKREQDLSVTCAYNSDLFDRPTILRCIEHYQVLLEGIVSKPTVKIDSLPLLTATERHQLLLKWNDTARRFPENSTVQELFMRQAQRRPDAIAVESERGQLSYGELNRLSDCLAHRLRDLGVKRGSLVAFFITRRLEMAIGLLGVLKAGGAYLPLDPGHPRERLRYIIEDASPELIITERRLLPDLPDPSLEVICLDDDFSKSDVKEEALADTTATDLVYVIYTSGSTGRPKGVLVTHRSLINNVLATARYIELKPGDRRLQMASLAFDVSAAEFFSCWLKGATVVLWSDDGASSLTRLLDFVTVKRISVASLPTFLWHELVNELENSRRQLPPELRLLIVGSEEALFNYLVRWYQITGGKPRWVNAYGPTETTITVTLFESKAENLDCDCRTVPIGRPIDNTKIYILDESLNLLPVGVPGELYIGGVGLAKGYLNKPELTAEKFINNPFQIGERFYRTGDLARYSADGNIEFLGRVDQQVKIRGFRVELGEIESIISKHTAVQQCAVVARTDGPNRKLIAYFAPASKAVVTETELRHYLKQVLPSYMIPEFFVQVERMPLGPTGKIDRSALPTPGQKCLESNESRHVTPRTHLEEQLVAIWSRVLGAGEVGIHDRFFDLGGHSLDAMRIASQLNDEHGIDVPIRTFIEDCTIAELARHLENRSND